VIALARICSDDLIAGLLNRNGMLTGRPNGGALHTVDFAPIIRQVSAAAELARGVEKIQRDDQAGALWQKVYADLSEGKPGMLGAVTSRAEAQTMRLACVYALLDGSAMVRVEHLMPALAVWEYCEDSARFIFGDALGDVTADEIIRELRQHPQQGMTRNEILEHFNRNKPSVEICRALGVLQENGLARMVPVCEHDNQKKPAERLVCRDCLTRSTRLTRLFALREEQPREWRKSRSGAQALKC
jgi:hypothetical protein